MTLFISGGEIFIILIAILVFFGADKIPEFARMMGKGVREFKKATDDIKREFNENSSGVMDDIKAIRGDISETFTKELSEPVEATVNETTNTFEEYKNDYNADYYYDNPDNANNYGGEYHTEIDNSTAAESTTDGADNPPAVPPTTDVDNTTKASEI